MQTASSRIWTRVVISISYDYNHYTTGALIVLYLEKVRMSHLHRNSPSSKSFTQFVQSPDAVEYTDYFSKEA